MPAYGGRNILRRATCVAFLDLEDGVRNEASRCLRRDYVLYGCLKREAPDVVKRCALLRVCSPLVIP